MTTELPGPVSILATLLVIFAVTYLLRLAPFLALRRAEDTALMTYLGRTMPLGVMAVLVVYTLRNVEVSDAPHGLPELVGVVVTAGLHVWRGNALVSIVGGTATYLLLLTVL